MRTWIVIAFAVAIPWMMTSSTLGLTVAAMSGCGLFEDACDQIKSDCRDKGGKPVNCKEKQTPVSDECECECEFEQEG